MNQDKNDFYSQKGIKQASSSIPFKNRWSHFLARIGYKRRFL